MHPPTPGNDTTTGIPGREFDAGALAGLREAVLGCATACGMPEDRAIEVMLAVHELAANSVRHGPGHGRLRMHLSAGALRCEVSDPGPASQNHQTPDRTSWEASAARGAAPWPVEHGHGLWLVRETADQLRATTGPRGSLVTAVFALPAAGTLRRTRRPGAAGDGTGALATAPGTAPSFKVSTAASSRVYVSSRVGLGIWPQWDASDAGRNSGTLQAGVVMASCRSTRHEAADPPRHRVV